MDPVNPVGLSRPYEDVSRVEKLRRARRRGKSQDEYRPSKEPSDGSPGAKEGVDTFKRSGKPETP